MRAFPIACWIFLALFGCQDWAKGKKSKSPAASVGPEAAVTDNDLAGAVITELIDSVISSMLLDPKDDADGGTLRTIIDDTDQRICSNGKDDDAGAATVSVVQTISFSGERAYSTRKANIGLESSLTTDRTWSKKGETLRCEPDGFHLDLSEIERQGLTADITFSYEKTTTVALEFTDRKKSLDRGRHVSASGTRSLVWQSESSGEGKVVFEEDLSIESKLDLKVKNGVGTEVTFTSAVKNADAGPLEIEVTRDLSSDDLLVRSIKSGEMDLSIAETGPRFTAVFDATRFIRESRCLPTSGIIAGNIYATTDAGTPARSYTIDFDKDFIEIIFNNGTSYAYTPEGCDFELEP
jgi:hypothetical protein